MEQREKGIKMTKAKTYAIGIGDAVANRTINRKILRELKQPRTHTVEFDRRDDVSLDEQVESYCKNEGWQCPEHYISQVNGDKITVELHITGINDVETWEDVALRVARGNSLLEPNRFRQAAEFDRLHHHMRQASILMSGRHLQHGDDTQPDRPQEVFTNCVDYSQRILTMEYGPIEIGKVAGDVVTVIAGDGVPRPAMINEHGVQDLYDITFRANSGGGGSYKLVVRATADHRWKLRNGTITESLKEGDVLAPIHADVGVDPEAVIHGLIFGDGTAHKRRRDNSRPGISQGRTYATMRVCKQDAVRDEVHEWFDAAGYSYTQPPHSAGDRVYYLGKMPYAKELPFARDPEYIAGFIYGWWLADGHKGVNHALEISTVNKGAIDWLAEHAGYAGFNVTSINVKSRKEGDGSYKNGKPLYIIRLRKDVEWKVDSIEHVGRAQTYCPEEPVTSTFVLANGLLTGNCSTSPASFLTFQLLLNGSGVGRSYDDAMMKVDWSYMPIIIPVIDHDHPDVVSGEIIAPDLRTAQHLYANKKTHVFEVPDTREGWAKAIEMIEIMAFQRKYRRDVLLLDFTKVRERGAPIKGMQNRPASGPGPLMAAIRQIGLVRNASMPMWRQTMYVDHYLSECVLVGGARRAARMSTKTWRDKSALEFISVKQGGFLWSSNNSVTVDEEFWELVNASEPPRNRKRLWKQAHAIIDALTYAAYHDGTGEPGLINQHMLKEDMEGVEKYIDGRYINPVRYEVEEETLELLQVLAVAALNTRNRMIVNPCGEIALSMLGGYCLIGDVVPFHAQNDNDAEDAFRTTVRALMRTNLMPSLYDREVKRTNRIGVGITGLHEWIWDRFGYGFYDILDEEGSKDMWLTLSRFKRAVVDEAQRYAEELGVVVPHTNTTIKPAGTTSKLFGLTEGAHLLSMREYLRWVQFRYDDPLVARYRNAGYPTRELKEYSGTTIVGFPTQPTICALDIGDKLVTAAEPTPEQQYQYLRLLEKYWIRGVDEMGFPLTDETGNQVSYTLKYDPNRVDFDTFKSALIEGQQTIRCCSVMPQTDVVAYEYQPEQAVTRHEYELICRQIDEAQALKEDVGQEHVDCANGACPVDFGTNSASI